MSQKRRTLWGTPGVRISAGQQHSGVFEVVKENFHQIMRNFLPIIRGAHATSRAGEGDSPSDFVQQKIVSARPPKPAREVRAGRALRALPLDKNVSQQRLSFESIRDTWRVRFLVTKVKRVTKLRLP